MNRFLATALAFVTAGVLSGCGESTPGPGNGPDRSPFEPLSTAEAVFWDRQTTETAALLQELVDRFNSTGPRCP